jgi:EmrB/QacA subfamily drug resistance transporter
LPGAEDSSATPPKVVQRWTLVATILASGIVFLDSTVVNVALPAIGRELNMGLSGLQWIVDGYVLTLAALLILGGSLGDRFGRRRIMLIGLVGFGAASASCGLAPSDAWLIGSRMVQGVGGAMLVPGSLAIIRSVFSEGEERGTAIGQWSGWSGITTVIGPLLGGWLVDSLSWRWVFFINLPIIALAAGLLLSHVPESRDEEAAKHLDWRGALLVTLGLGGLVFGLIQGPVAGWRSPYVLAGLGGGLVGLLLFVAVEARAREPMVPLDIFRSRAFTGANLTTLGVYFALYGTMFFLVIYLQNVMGYSALDAGLVLAPVSLLMLLLSPLFGKLAGRHGPRLYMSIGPLACGCGLLAFLRVHPDSGYWTGVLPAVLILGLGLACTVAPLTNTVVSAVSGRRSGIAAAINNAVSRIAALLAIGGLGVVVTLAFNASLERQAAGLSLPAPAQAALQRVAQNPTGSADVAGLPPNAAKAVRQSYTFAFHRAMVVAAAMAWAGGLVAALTLRNGDKEQNTENSKIP